MKRDRILHHIVVCDIKTISHHDALNINSNKLFEKLHSKS